MSDFDRLLKILSETRNDDQNSESAQKLLLDKLQEEKEKGSFARADDGQTFLHKLVDDRTLMKQRAPAIQEFILEADPSAILTTYDEVVPLAEYLRRGPPDIVASMIKVIEKHDMRLDHDSEDAGKTCIREAFRSHAFNRVILFSIDLMGRLVDRATPIMLREKASGLSPLQQAVHYEISKQKPKGQLGLVKKLLDKHENSIFDFVPINTVMSSSSSKQIFTKRQFSVFEWHIFTKTMCESDSAIASAPSAPSNGRSPKAIQRTNSIALEEPGYPSSSKGGTHGSKTAGALKDLSLNGRHDNSSEKGVKKDVTQLKDVPTKTGRGPTNISKASSHHAPNEQQNGQIIAKDIDDASKSVLQELTLRFLRSTFRFSSDSGPMTTNDESEMGTEIVTRNNAIDNETFFGKQNCDYHFTLDMRRQYHHMNTESFCKYFLGVKYCSILRLVILPDIRVYKGLQKKGKASTDQLFFLHWLRKDKQVKKIIKLIVKDSSDALRRDEDIEDVLIGPDKDTKSQSFDIEILDWRKLDLCPVVIYNSALRVRELHLQWSGNNSVLRGWSEPDGLAKLPSLRRLYLHFSLPNSHERRSQQNIEAFKDRLRISRDGWRSRSQTADDFPDIIFHNKGVYPLGGDSGPGQSLTNQANERKEDPWFTYVKDFVNLVPDIPAILSLPDSWKSKDCMRSVTVALIDDGVDVFSKSLENFQSRIRPGASFDTSEDGPGPEHASVGGHGTVMAQAILRMCPCATIIPIRLMTQPDSKSYFPRPLASSAAKAIKEAIRRDVDVISMSWTIRSKGTSDQNQGINELESVLKELPPGTRIPLMFCAASDDGIQDDYRSDDYPRAIAPDKIFCIGAAKSSGEVWPHVTQAGKLQYLFPGVDIQMVVENSLDESQRVALANSEKSGSSIATAFAAGLAALLIHCTKLSIYYTEATKAGGNHPRETFEPSSLAEIRSFETMKIALNNLTVKNASDQAFALPQVAFREATRKLKRFDDDGGVERGMPESLLPIAKLIRDRCLFKS